VAKRYSRKNNSSDGAIIPLAIIGFALYLIVLLAQSVIFWIVVGVVLSIYGLSRYIKWQDARLRSYYSWKEFYTAELRNIIAEKIGFTLTIAGFVLMFARFWVGTCIVVFALLFFRKTYTQILSVIPRYLPQHRAIILLAILMITLWVNKEYDNEKIKDGERQRIAEQYLRIQEEENIKLEKQRIDSSNYFLSMSKQLVTKKKFASAMQQVNKSLEFYNQNGEAFRLRAQLHDRLKNYTQAINDFGHVGDAEAQVSIAQCYLKAGNKLEAIRYFKRGMDSGSAKAVQLYNKYNPIIKEIVGYVTRCCDGSCCDGSTSSATGRGACSHHNGVCNWHDPIYNKRRKYGDL
jgi:hypothetical protein